MAKWRHRQQELVSILSNTIATVCRNYVTFRDDLELEGLIGVTIDQDQMMLINVKRTVRKWDSDNTKPVDLTVSKIKAEDGESNQPFCTDQSEMSEKNGFLENKNEAGVKVSETEKQYCPQLSTTEEVDALVDDGYTNISLVSGNEAQRTEMAARATTMGHRAHEAAIGQQETHFMHEIVENILTADHMTRTGHVTQTLHTAKLFQLHPAEKTDSELNTKCLVKGDSGKPDSKGVDVNENQLDMSDDSSNGCNDTQSEMPCDVNETGDGDNDLREDSPQPVNAKHDKNNSNVSVENLHRSITTNYDPTKYAADLKHGVQSILSVKNGMIHSIGFNNNNNSFSAGDEDVGGVGLNGNISAAKCLDCMDSNGLHSPCGHKMELRQGSETAIEISSPVPVPNISRHSCSQTSLIAGMGARPEISLKRKRDSLENTEDRDHFDDKLGSHGAHTAGVGSNMEDLSDSDSPRVKQPALVWLGCQTPLAHELNQMFYAKKHPTDTLESSIKTELDEDSQNTGDVLPSSEDGTSAANTSVSPGHVTSKQAASNGESELETVSPLSMQAYEPEVYRDPESGRVRKHFRCPACPKVMQSMWKLRRHLSSHTGHKPYRCELCGKEFVESGLLTRHLRTHSGEKPFRCAICCQVFTDSGNLRKHRRLHTGAAPHECYMCGESFHQLDDLYSHMGSHSGARPFECALCGKNFTQPGHLSIHRLHCKTK